MSAIFLIAVPLLAAFLSIMMKKISSHLLILVALFNVVALFFLKEGFVVIGGFHQPLGINLLVDTYSLLSLFLLNGLILIISFLNFKQYKSYGSILLLALAGLNGLLLTNDLFNLFVFLEISGIAAYLISSSNNAPRSTFQYVLLGAVGSSLFLFGVIVLYAMYGTLNLVGMIQAIQNSGNYSEVILPFTLMFVGFGVEAKILPFNSWVKGVLGSSNTLSGPMIASVYAGSMSFVLGRLITNLFAFEGSLLMVVTIILVVGIIMGDVMAFASTKTREILLYSSVAQASIVALLFVNGIVIWAVYLIIANALSKMVMFMVINKASEKVGSDESESLRGLFTNNYVIGVAFTLATLSVMGLPLLVGFQIKLSFLTGLAQANHIWLIIFMLSASIVEGIYFVKLLVKLWYKGEQQVQVHYNFLYKFVFVLVAIGLLVFGTYSTPLQQLDNTIDTIMEVVNNG
jgi:multicomponent Na+:H+ antiporter subunit D